MFKRGVVLLYLISTLTGTAFTRNPTPAPAPNPPPGPDRYAVIAVEYTNYEWYMATWKGARVVCSVIVEHEGPPLPEEVFRDCGEDIHDTWVEQRPCLTFKISLCEGYYTFLVDSWPMEREIAMQLAPASAWISLEDCEPVLSTSTNIC